MVSETMTDMQHKTTPADGQAVGPEYFDTPVDRRPIAGLKWHYFEQDVLPMWVADMDFRSPEPVMRALQARVEHGVFGYGLEPPTLRPLVLEWLARRYGWQVEPRAIVFLPGVVSGLNLALQALLAPGQGVLVQTPVYPPLLKAPGHHGLVRQENELLRGADGHYTIDLEAFEAAISAETRLFMLCNPHNPVGRVFTVDELARMAEICLRHDLLICADEIHDGLVFAGHRHVPIAALDPEIACRTITFMAPSKTFNIAGLNCAFAVIENQELRRRVRQNHEELIGGVNVLGFAAAEAAYREGGPWLAGLLHYLQGNRDLVVTFVREHMPGIRTAAPQGTYLAWLDCREAGIPGNAYRFFLKEAGVALNEGESFGRGGEGFVRLNFGCPRAMLLAALERMQGALARVRG